MTDKLRHGPLWTTIFAIISLIWIYPIALVFINSFKKRVYISKDVFSLPTGDTFVGLENYERGIEKTNILPSFGWTIILTLGSVALILLCCSMCAWWIVRVNNWVAKLMYLAFIASMVVPFQMVMFPLSKLTDTLDLNTPWGMWLVYLGFGAGLPVFIFTGVIKSIPSEIEEAAMIDGAGSIRTFFTIVLPMMRPAYLRGDPGDDVGVERLPDGLSVPGSSTVQDAVHRHPVPEGRIRIRGHGRDDGRSGTGAAAHPGVLPVRTEVHHQGRHRWGGQGLSPNHFKNQSVHQGKERTMKTKKMMAIVAAAVMAMGAMAGCGSSSAADPDKGKVYFVNNKKEIVDQLEDLADQYTKETGVQVKVLTAADGYDNTLASELAKTEAPTMWSITGYPNFIKWKDYMEPVQDSAAFKLLTDEGKANSYQADGNHYTLPYAAEWFGIIYNKKIVNDYASKDYAVIDSADDIKDWDTFKAVVEDMQAHKDDLGIEGAMATPGLESSDLYRFASHMTRIPLFYEYKDNNTTFMPEIKGTYVDNYKALFDLEMNNCPTSRTLLTSKTYEDVTAEFSLGEVAFYPNGVWAYTQVKDNEVADKDLGMLPYFMGIPGEEKYGPAGIYDASWAVNKNASEKDKQATFDFIEWLFSSDEGKKVMSQDMGFAVPSTAYGDKDQPDNPLTAAARKYETNGVPMVRSFSTLDAWGADVQDALVEYVNQTGKWDAVADAYTNGWAKEWKTFEDTNGVLPEATTLNGDEQ